MAAIDPVVAPSPAGLLLERERHVEAFTGALEEVAGGAGTTVLIVGEAGVGKSMLLRELTGRAGGRATVLRARGDELEQEFPYGVARQLLEPLLRTLQDVWDGPAELARSVFTPGAEGPSDDPSFARQQGLYWLVVNLAERLGPLVLAVDDAHRADEPSLRFMRFLGHRLDGLPVAQVLASRPLAEIEHRPALADMLEDPLVQTLAVDRLSREATAAFLERAWPEGATLAAVCHELTGGNPLMLRALVTEARGTVDTAAGLRALGVRPIGQRVRRALAGAPAGALELAQAVAVLGDDTPAVEAVAFAGADPIDILLRAGILEEGPRGLRFVHPLVRTSVYRLLSPVERAAAHLRAARTLHARGVSGELVAAHLLHTGPVGEPWAARVLDEAAERALASGAPESAAQLIARALEEPDAGVAERARRLARLGDAQSSAGVSDALGSYERALALTPGAVAITLQYSGALAMAGRTVDAFAVLDGAQLPDDPTIRAALHAAALFTDSSAAREHRDAVAARTPDGPLLAATTAYELAMRNAPVDRVAALAVPVFGGGALPLELSTTMAYGYAVWALILSERFDVARAELDRAVELGRRTGTLVVHALALLLRAGTNLRAGALQAAEADAQQSLALSEHPSWRFGNAAAMQILLAQGRVQEAAAAAARIDAHTVQGVSVVLLAEQARARVLLAQRQPEAALAAAEALGRHAALALFDNPVFLPWRETAALAAAAAGRPERAAALAAEQVALAGAYGVAAEARLVEALVARDAERIEAAAAVDRPLVRARGLLALGRMRRVAGSLTAAREPLREAMELASACGAVGLVDEALDELAAAGARPRRRAGSGALALTAAEARVARLAADGASNREIAQELFVTLKTVEMHLSSAYRKLDISSRAQLASRLD
ncbi:AAA family ATPase [Solirubrobacter sp. CPCC 204708]|nr:AAA family ATPase [Solirubrobacter deserti]